jgi:wyosine [tRNA(Phe)-imidazoG37] synthetase (radical SAM superfamily)
MRHVFGPVPSRRLGRSLGIDPVPSKLCNWNCVYCQLGHTVPPVADRDDYFPAVEVLGEVREALASKGEEAIDWITFVGSGETTLHSRLGEMIRGVKEMTELPVAVITNGSLLYDPAVREELLPADAVMPSVDAGSQDLYLRINRPHRDLEFGRFVDGLVAFRDAYEGLLWVEVMLLEGVNDTVRALADLAGVLARIRPDEVHLNVPSRPPAEEWARAPGDAALQRAREVLGSVARHVTATSGTFDLSGCADAVDAIRQIITRHPMSEEEVAQSLARWSGVDVSAALARLEASGAAQRIERAGRVFWCSAEGRYR